MGGTYALVLDRAGDRGIALRSRQHAADALADAPAHVSPLQLLSFVSGPAARGHGTGANAIGGTLGRLTASGQTSR